MNQRNVLKGLQIQRTIPYRDPDALFALVGADGNGKTAYMPVGENILSRHILLLGSPGTGKTNLLSHLLRNIRAHLTPADVMVIFDPTGEYTRAFYQPGDIVFSEESPPENPEEEASIDPDKKTEKTEPAAESVQDFWNLFAELCEEDRILEDASALCSLLFGAQIRESAEPFCAAAARDLMMALIVYLYRRGGSELQNNLALRELIDGFDIDSMRQILEQETDLRALAAYLSKPNSPETLSIIAALQVFARELLQGCFCKEGSLGIRPLVRARGGKVLFICYDAARGHTLQPLYASLIDLCLQEALSRKENNGNIYLCLDGAGALPYLPHLEDALLFGRSKGLKLMLSASGVSQLEHYYGAARTQSLLCSFGTAISFLLHDRQSRDFVKGLYGRHRVVESFASSVQVRGIIEQVMDPYIIEDEDLTALQPGESIIATMHYPPFFFRSRPYEGG